MEKKQALPLKGGIPDGRFYDQIAEQYEEAFSNNIGLRKNVHTFLTLLPTAGPVLDCGCGTGRPVAELVSQSGHPLYGIDMSRTMIELSRQRVPEGKFEQCNMLEYTPPTKFSGIIAMLSLFELSRSELTTMAHRWFEWIQPGGFLLIGVFGAEDCRTEPEMYDSDGVCASGIEFKFMGHKVSMTLFTKAGWNRLLENAGFEVAYTETDVYVPPPAFHNDDEPQYFVIARRPSVA